MLKSKEHYDLMAQFEQDIKSSNVHFNPRLERADKSLWDKGHVYNHGETNSLFIAYRLGYSFAKALGRT